MKSALNNERVSHEDEVASYKDRVLQLQQIASEAERGSNGMLMKELDSLNIENTSLKNRIDMLSNDQGQVIDDAIHQERVAHAREIDDLKRCLEDAAGPAVMDLRRRIDELEIEKRQQKDEWAEIYSSMKQEISDLKNDINILDLENKKLLKYSDKSGQASKQAEREVVKKLKKRELECAALWDTLRDMYVAPRKVYDKKQMMELLAIRALDTKAQRKLFK